MAFRTNMKANFHIKYSRILLLLNPKFPRQPNPKG